MNQHLHRAADPGLVGSRPDCKIVQQQNMDFCMLFLASGLAMAAKMAINAMYNQEWLLGRKPSPPVTRPSVMASDVRPTSFNNTFYIKKNLNYFNALDFNKINIII